MKGPCLPWWEMQAQGGQDHAGHTRRRPCVASRKCLSGAWEGIQHRDRPCPSPGHTPQPISHGSQEKGEEGRHPRRRPRAVAGVGAEPTSPGPRTKLAHAVPMSPAMSRLRVKTPAHGHSAAEAATSRPRQREGQEGQAPDLDQAGSLQRGGGRKEWQVYRGP